MKSAFLTVLLFTSTPAAYAAQSKADWVLREGRLTYHVHYPLKNVEGVATNVKGKGHCEKGNCQFLVAVPLKNFKSGDGNRDNHMLEVTKAATDPMVTVRVSFPEPVKELIDARAEVLFAGKSHTYEHVQIATSSHGSETVTKGKLPLALSQYGVERPELLTVKIDDEVPVDFDLTWN